MQAPSIGGVNVPRGDGTTVIQAEVPAGEIQRYATDLRSITQGRGTFESEFVRYPWRLPSRHTSGPTRNIPT